MPGHVRASLNWNKLKDMNSDRYSLTIMDGQKTIVCKLKNNLLNMTSVAYPIDQLQLPEWFIIAVNAPPVIVLPNVNPTLPVVAVTCIKLVAPAANAVVVDVQLPEMLPLLKMNDPPAFIEL